MLFITSMQRNDILLQVCREMTFYYKYAEQIPFYYNKKSKCYLLQVCRANTILLQVSRAMPFYYKYAKQMLFTISKHLLQVSKCYLL